MRALEIIEGFPIKLYELDTIKGFMWRHYLNVKTGLLESYHEQYPKFGSKLLEYVTKTLNNDEVIEFMKQYSQYYIADLDS